MSRLDQLVQKLCPDGVEWDKLESIVSIITAPTKLNRREYKKKGELPIIDQGMDFIAGYADRSFESVKCGEYIIFGDHSEHIKYVNFAFVQGADGIKILQISKHSTKYVYYAFSNFYRKESNYKRHWASAKETLIPLPPLEIQQEIVDILDRFTELEAELEAEREAREKQYAYYRDALLDFSPERLESGHVSPALARRLRELCPNGVGCVHLLDVADVLYGYPCDSSKFNEDGEGVPLVRIRDVLHGITTTYTTEEIPNEYLVDKGDLLVGMDGNFHIGNWKSTKSILCQRVCKISPKTEPATVLNRFLSHLLVPIIKKVEDNKHSGTVKHLLAKDLKAIKIPLPPLEIQQEIVNILDRFDELAHGITSGLPAELAARRKQYEHYRDKLLAFEPRDKA